MKLRLTKVKLIGDELSDVELDASWAEIKEVAADLGVDFKKMVEVVGTLKENEAK